MINKYFDDLIPEVFTLKNYLIKDGSGEIFSKEVLKLYSEEIFKYFNILESLESLVSSGRDEDKIKTSLKDIVTMDFTNYNLLYLDDISADEKDKIYGEKQNMLQKNNIESAEDFVRDLTNLFNVKKKICRK